MLVVKGYRSAVQQEFLLKDHGRPSVEIDNRVIVLKHINGVEKYLSIIRNESNSPSFQVTLMEKVIKNK